jgi:hypothetical protein
VGDPVGLTGEQLVTIRDLWQVVSRQIEQMLVSQDFTGRIEVNCLHSRVKNYVPARTVIPEEEERRLKQG